MYFLRLGKTLGQYHGTGLKFLLVLTKVRNTEDVDLIPTHKIAWIILSWLFWISYVSYATFTYEKRARLPPEVINWGLPEITQTKNETDKDHPDQMILCVTYFC